MRAPGVEGSRPHAVLAIETATADGSVALRVGERTREKSLQWRASFREVAPAIEELMAEAGLRWADLDAIAVPSGPGSFTGLRVGAALALGLSKTAGRPLYGVPTLAAVAEAHAPPGAPTVCATLDARRGRRYAALYERAGSSLWELVAGPVDAGPEAVGALAGDAPRIGPDLDRDRTGGPGLAAAIARLVATDPDRYAQTSPRGLELVYTRPGLDSR
jgi:tRNA threonylcarbamoyl adenosine modification protein YeaZ